MEPFIHLNFLTCLIFQYTAQIFSTVFSSFKVGARLSIIISWMRKKNPIDSTEHHLLKLQLLNARFWCYCSTGKHCDLSSDRIADCLYLALGRKLQIWRCLFFCHIFYKITISFILVFLCQNAVWE